MVLPDGERVASAVANGPFDNRFAFDLDARVRHLCNEVGPCEVPIALEGPTFASIEVPIPLHVTLTEARAVWSDDGSDPYEPSVTIVGAANDPRGGVP